MAEVSEYILSLLKFLNPDVLAAASLILQALCFTAEIYITVFKAKKNSKTDIKRLVYFYLL